jgi:hypothetical protein
VYALNGKWKVTDKFTLEADLSFQDSQFDTTFVAIRTDRCRRRSAGSQPR